MRRAHDESEGRRVRERGQAPQRRNVRMERVDVPVCKRVDSNEAVEVGRAWDDQHQPCEQEVPEDRQTQDRGLPVQRQASPDPWEKSGPGDDSHGAGASREATSASGSSRDGRRNRHSATTGPKRPIASTGQVIGNEGAGHERRLPGPDHVSAGRESPTFARSMPRALRGVPPPARTPGRRSARTCRDRGPNTRPHVQRSAVECVASGQPVRLRVVGQAAVPDKLMTAASSSTAPPTTRPASSRRRVVARQRHGDRIDLKARLISRSRSRQVTRGPVRADRSGQGPPTGVCVRSGATRRGRPWWPRNR